MFTASPLQTRFRFVNEEILRQSEPTLPFESLAFICECRDPSCFGVLPLTASSFAQLTSVSSYAVLNGHPTGKAMTRLSSQAA